MYDGHYTSLACGHQLCNTCFKKSSELIKSKEAKDECPTCREKGAFSMLLKPDYPTHTKKEKMEMSYYQVCEENLKLKKQLKQLQQDKDKWEREARSLWEQFVTDEMIQSDFIWRVRAKKYI